MILTEEEVKGRIESPLNLLNRLKAAAHGSSSPCIPSIDSLIGDVDARLNEHTSKIKAKQIMNLALDELKSKVAEISRPKDLAIIAKQMAEIVESDDVKREVDDGNRPQIIIYAPQVVQENNYETITVQE